MAYKIDLLHYMSGCIYLRRSHIWSTLYIYITIYLYVITYNIDRVQYISIYIYSRLSHT